MTWDWKKLLKTQNAPLEESSPEEAPVATGDSPQETMKDSSGIPFQGASGNAPARPERPPGLAWESTDTIGKTGQATTKGRSPELLYGQEHNCAYCKGTGLMRTGDKCPVCRGVGQVKVTPPVVQCKYCHGGGHVPLGSTVTCPVCRGKGVNQVKAPVEMCPDCNGRGRPRGAALYCGRCRGAGVVTKPKPDTTGDARLRVVKMDGPRLGPPKLRDEPDDDFGHADKSDSAPPPDKQKQGLQWQPAPRSSMRAARTG